MAGKLCGKVALITGANSGIGLATAKQFVSEGAYVFITGRRQADLDAATREIGDNAMGIQGDVAILEDLDRLYDTIKRERGYLDVLFANAGLGEFSPLDEITEAHFDQTFDVNVRGTLFTVQKALPLLRDGSAIIVNVSTAASTGVPAFGVYSATKAALRSFVRTWMLELKDRQIRVNAVSPGPIETPGVSSLLEGSGQGDAVRAGLIASVPLGRMGRPDEVAKAVVFLASDDSSFVNGTELFVDGGSAQV